MENFKEEFPDLADNGRVEVYNICSAVSRQTSTEKVQYYSKVYCWLKTDIQAERRYNKVYSWLKTDIQAQRRYSKVYSWLKTDRPVQRRYNKV